MDPARARAAKLKAWQRFGDRVASNPDWPRSLWLAAVDDALAAALGPESRIYAEFRTQVGELLTLERASPRGYQDELRIAELEGRIERLIELADDMVKAGPRPLLTRRGTAGCGRCSLRRSVPCCCWPASPAPRRFMKPASTPRSTSRWSGSAA